MSDFARIGLGICYDVRFPEMTAISARQGKTETLVPQFFRYRLSLRYRLPRYDLSWSFQYDNWTFALGTVAESTVRGRMNK